MTPTKTPLTEQQARSLAYWWGGEYQQTLPAPGENCCGHGVIVRRLQGCGLVLDPTPVRVFSLEEARELEDRRGFQEAASPDWVG